MPSLGSKATTSHSKSRQGPDASFRLAFRGLTSYAALRIRLPVIMCYRRHRHMEFIRFHNAVEREVRAEKPIHGARQLCHRQASRSAGLALRDPRWTFHFIPTSASWLNAVENFFILDHSATHSPTRLPFDCRLPDRHQCSSRQHNANSRRFVWTKSADAIRAKLGRRPVSSESA